MKKYVCEQPFATNLPLNSDGLPFSFVFTLKIHLHSIGFIKNLSGRVSSSHTWFFNNELSLCLLLISIDLCYSKLILLLHFRDSDWTQKAWCLIIFSVLPFSLWISSVFWRNLSNCFVWWVVLQWGVCLRFKMYTITWWWNIEISFFCFSSFSFS